MKSLLNPETHNNLPLPTFIRDAWTNLWTRYYFKFVLPGIRQTEIEGVTLDLTPFSPRIRNRIMRGYEAAEMRCCRQLLRRDDRVLELGGGIGFVGLFCQKVLGVQDYVTVEANPHTIAILKKNYELNGVTPRVFNYAISDRIGSIELNIDGDFWEHNLEKAHAGNKVKVPTITLPQLLRQLPTPPTTLVIDIEGAEQFIEFRKITEDIQKVIIEIHPMIIGQQATKEIVAAFCERGFRMVCEEGNTLAFTRSL